MQKADGHPGGDALVVVFDYLDAVPIDAAVDGDRLGGLIARVHQQTERVASRAGRRTDDLGLGA